jgi:predicted transcriptional regulator
MSRPAHRPDPVTRRQVEAMAAYGVPEADVARVLGIDPKTLRKHYREELDTGSIKANSRIAESLYKKATGEGPQSVTACIFWLKTRARWKETVVNEVSITSDPLTDLLNRIAERGRRIHDPVLSEEARVMPTPPAEFKVIDGDLAPLTPRERA